MKQPIFYVGNSDRKEQFATETAILADKTSKRVLKAALFSDGADHIDKLQSTFSMLSNIPSLKKQVSISPAQPVKTGSVEFAYIEGTSAERLLVNRFMAGDIPGMLRIIEKLFSVIDSLPETQTNPTNSKNFLSVFGESYDKKQACTKIGLTDLNLDNFIVDKKGVWHLFDYEWCFDFAIPKDYLTQRFLFWFFLVRYKDIALLRGSKLAMVEIGKELFIPKDIYAKYKAQFDDMQQLIEAEWAFQDYVHAIPRKTTKDEKKFDIEFYSKALPVKTDKISQVLQQRNLVSQYEKVSAGYADLIQRYRSNENELILLKQSKLYKYRQKASKLKTKLSLKK